MPRVKQNHPTSFSNAKEAEANSAVRWYAFDSSQTAVV